MAFETDWLVRVLKTKLTVIIPRVVFDVYNGWDRIITQNNAQNILVKHTHDRNRKPERVW